MDTVDNAEELLQAIRGRDEAMITNSRFLAAIRQRDTEAGVELPNDQWQAQLDRRNLLRMLDAALQSINDLEAEIEARG